MMNIDEANNEGIVNYLISKKVSRYMIEFVVITNFTWCLGLFRFVTVTTLSKVFFIVVIVLCNAL